jgi:hypothetical protein
LSWNSIESQDLFHMSAKWIVLGVVIAGVAAGAIAYRHRVTQSRAARISAVELEFRTDPLLSRISRSGPMSRPRDHFRTIVNPKYVAADEAFDSMGDDESVLGLELAGEYRAYSTNYLNDHEMVQDEIAGMPLLITW